MSDFHSASERKRVISSRARGIAVSIVWLFFLQWLDYQGWFAGVNGKVFNHILRTHASREDSPASQEIYVIEIDDPAYNDCFRNRSPMDPAGILKVVTSVADANPKTIGVAIQTEGFEYSKHIKDLPQYVSSIVWVSAFDHPEPHSAGFPSWLFGDRDYIAVSPKPVLGTEPFALHNLRQTNWGLPLYPTDDDGNVRRFPRTVHLTATDVRSGGTAPSWATRVADVYCQPECTAESADEIDISYAGAPPHESKLQELFTCSIDPHSPDGPIQIEAGGAKWNDFKSHALGKIVLIGGTFSESKDFYRTPKGHLPGLMVNAYAVKAGLNGNGFEELRQPWAWLLDLLLGLLIVWICDEQAMKRLNQIKALRFVSGWRRKKIVFSTGIVVLICIGSLFVARGRYLLGFAGEGAGVLIDRMRELWDFAKDEKD